MTMEDAYEVIEIRGGENDGKRVAISFVMSKNDCFFVWEGEEPSDDTLIEGFFVREGQLTDDGLRVFGPGAA